MGMPWLMKTEPDVFSLEDLKRKKRSLWDGVRNYQARNFMLNEMQVGDEVLFYHSSTDPSGVAGLARVSAKAVPDPSAFDKKSEYYEPKATKEKPIWYCVEVEYVETFKHFIPLADIHKHKALAKMGVIRKGNRLSIQPVTEAEFAYLCRLGREQA